MLAAIATPSWSGNACIVMDGRTPLAVKHWLAQPAAVRHCGIDPQFGMESWHAQSAGLPAVIAVVIAHDLAIATLATGAKAIVSARRRATMVRRKIIECGLCAKRFNDAVQLVFAAAVVFVSYNLHACTSAERRLVLAANALVPLRDYGSSPNA